MRIKSLENALYHPPVPGIREWPGFRAVDDAFDFSAEEDRQELINMMVEHA